uniref:Uncharacterized protein n=1 Tax=Arundo donax TaxID=35708 RepID=A0A0A9A0K4_ARUDO
MTCFQYNDEHTRLSHEFVNSFFFSMHLLILWTSISRNMFVILGKLLLICISFTFLSRHTINT